MTVRQGAPSGAPTLRGRRGTGWQAGDQQWFLALLPGFPLVLLVLRVWYLSRQDLPTMLLLVQYVSPLGLVSVMLVMLIWMLPIAILLCRMFGVLLWASAPTVEAALASRLTSLSQRIPNWVVTLAILLAAFTWQLRFLPVLLMITLAVLALSVRGRNAATFRVSLVCTALPIAAAVAVYAWCGRAITDAIRADEWVTATLFALPPALTVFLTGPVPARAARWVTHWVAVGVAVLAPFLIGAIFVRAPVLPTVALEVEPGSGGAAREVLRGRVITVDDRMTTLLDQHGTVQFVPNDRIVSKTLCPEDSQVPSSVVMVHAWPVEQTSLAWLTTSRAVTSVDPRCQGRPVGGDP